MRYDENDGVIHIGVREFVETARRGIRPSSADALEESSVKDPGAIARRFLPEGTTEAELSLLYSRGGRGFRLFGTSHLLGDEILLVKEWETASRSPKRDDVAAARGEGFILAHMYAKEKSLASVMLTIVYINQKNGARVTTKESVDEKKSTRFFEKCASALDEYAKPEIERVTVRLPSMKNARFPYGKVRDGQSEFITSVYKNLTRGGTLFAMAPTGTGKTVSVLYPAIRALGDSRCDKVFYFTPKTTTAEAAKDCLLKMSGQGLKIKAVTIGAKERICRRGVLCREGKDLCPAAKETVKAALALYESGVAVVGENELLRTAEQYGVCPHELSLTYSELCDIIICDINYLFDPRVYIKRYFTEGGRFAFLVDEAHNLPDRAREMYSAEMSEERVALPASAPELSEHSPLKALSEQMRDELRELLYPYVKDEIRTDKEGIKHAFSHLSEPPARLYEIFGKLLEAAESELLSALRARDADKDARIKFLRTYLGEIRRVSDTLDMFDSGFEIFISLNGDSLSFKLFCIDTSSPISRRLEKGHAAVFFSATLAPLSYYRSVLGGDRSAGSLEVDSPFDPSQLSVTVMDKISTRWSEREDTLTAVCRAIAACVSAKRGHYMIFSPSFAYSEALAKVFSAKYPKIKTLMQKRDMSKKERSDFLAEFEKNEGAYLVAFCVMGGIYSEGIDLAGDSLIGAVIVGIGMPSLSAEREAIAAYYDEKCDEGKQYAYIYPGMNRVFQAAGRVIRREGDKGVIVLIDDRFADPIYKKSIPSLWADMAFSDDPKALRERLDEFWKSGEATEKGTP